MKFLPHLLIACTLSAVFTSNAQLPAFPGAQGLGRFATGGRGGSVYHVTTTNDSGAGSFRDAVSVSGRTVVFDIGGIIDYQPPRYAPKPNITIAAQTAPGDGVTLYGNGLSFSGSHNNIVRFLRVRQGINGDSGTDAIGIANGHDMIFDHLSVSWGRDETFSINGAVTNITIQSSIISQGLQTHSAGGLVQTEGGVSIYRCLYIDNDTRNPKVKFANEFVNNVVANWETIGYNMGGDSAGDSYANAFNNYFIRGPYSSSSAFGGGNANFHIYATNNWYDGNRDGILNGTELPFANYGDMDLQSVPFPQYPITSALAVPPLTALKLALSDVGSSQRRDSVDERLMTEILSGGVLGQTINSEYASPMNGPGVIRNGPNPTDTDQDGMPNYWENGTGSNPNSADNNSASPSGSGYTRLEDYLNWLAEPHGIALTDTTMDIELRQFFRGFTNYNPSFSVANPTNGTVSIVAGGKRARFVPTPGLNGPASFNFTVTDANGSTFTRPFNLFFTPTPVVPVTNVIWRGDALANNWNAAGDLNWFDGYSLLYPFQNGNGVTFDDSGFNAPNVNLLGTLTPLSVTVNAAQNYALSGSGTLSGAMSLTKSGAGIYRLSNTNNYSGSTTVSAGTLLVNGTLTSSAVTVLNGGSAGGNGRFGNGLIVQSGATLTPGDGIGAAGRMTITNSFTEAGGVTNRFDFSDDPTGTLKTNDVIQIIGDLNLSGTNTVKISLLDGLPGNGVYTLFTYTGNLNGSLSNLKVIGVGGTLTNLPNAIAIIVSAVRPPAALVWKGDGVNNIWDNGTNVNWLNDAAPDRFYYFDDVGFGDSGSFSPSVNLIGDLTPNSLTVTSALNFTFGGSGKITGATGLVKSNSGTLTITTTNDYTGATIINGGVLAVTRLANGNNPSGIGGSSSAAANLQLNNGTLRYTGGTVAIDRSATLTGSNTLDISSGTFTANGAFTGSGTLTKAGTGTLVITTNNTHTGTIISNGTVNLTTTAARDSGLGTGTTTLAGGTLQLYGYGGSTGTDWGTFNDPLNVIAGTTNTLLTPPRCSIGSTLTGSGTLNLTVDYVRDALSGNWSAFAGTINVTGRVAASEFRVANTAGYGNATVFITDNVIITRNGSPAGTVYFGALGGTSGSSVGPGNSSSSGATYSVGGNNADATFAGTIKSDGTNPFIKTGTGRWTLTGANTWNGGLTINGGLVLANNTSGSATGTGAVVVNNTGALGGTGSVSSAVTVNSGGAVAPGNNGVGTVTLTGGLTLNSGALLNFDLGATNASDKIAVTGALALNGTLNLTNVAGFGPGTYTLITYSGALSGSGLTLGTKPTGYNYSVSTATANQVRLTVTAQTPPKLAGINYTGGNAVLAGSNGTPAGSYYVLTSTNAALPLSNWTRLATNQFDASGNFSFTNTPDNTQRFFRLQLP